MCGGRKDYSSWLVVALKLPITIILGVRMRIMPRARYWKNSMNNHVILKGVDVEV